MAQVYEFTLTLVVTRKEARRIREIACEAIEEYFFVLGPNGSVNVTPLVKVKSK